MTPDNGESMSAEEDKQSYVDMWSARSEQRGSTPLPCMGGDLPPETTMAESQNNDAVPVLFVAYEDAADLDIDNSGGGDPHVANHDELVNNGETYDEIRMMKRSSVDEHGLDVVTEGDSLWDDRFKDAEIGDAWRVDELRE